MSKRILQLIGALFLALGGGLLAVYVSDAQTQQALVQWWQRGAVVEEQATSTALRDVAERLRGGLPQTTEKQTEIITPTPLRSAAPVAEGTLTAAGVVTETNRRRTEAGLPELARNSALDQAALAKVEDMFASQYFEHVAPDGTDVGDLANAAGYEYIIVGENLALGGYDGDADLVQAWMDSPGHRENILHARFTEIGVAAKKGTFDGREVWLAVQEFGKPRSACPAPNEGVESLIDQHNEQLDEWQVELAERKTDIAETSKLSPVYNRKVREYNALVERYNELLLQTKELVNGYNLQVQAFNACAQA